MASVPMDRPQARGRLAPWSVVAAAAAVLALGTPAGGVPRGAAPGSAPVAPHPVTPAQPVLVFAAASLADALEEVGRALPARTGVRVNASYAASSVLAKQIEAGAPADIFFSADLAWVDYLDQRGLLRRGSRREVLGNSLVLIAPADSRLQVALAPGVDLAAALGEGRLAVADPDSVPAGEYARAALTQLGIWEPIRYVLALTAGSRPQAAGLAEFLTGPSAQEIFARYGFVLLSRPAATDKSP